MPENFIVIVLIGLVTGGLIGTVGVGGILLSPLLALVAGIDLQQAMAIASASFLATGLAGTYGYAKERSIDWNMAAWLSVGLIPTAVAGARANQLLGSAWLSLVLALLIGASGIHTLWPAKTSHQSRSRLGTTALISIGAVVGFGSALTGTGGPVLLLPILLPLGVPALAAIGVSQAIQVPVAVAASLTHELVGELDVPLSIWLGVIQVLGVVAGAAVAHRLRSEKLRMLVGVALVAVALVIGPAPTDDVVQRVPAVEVGERLAVAVPQFFAAHRTSDRAPDDL